MPITTFQWKNFPTTGGTTTGGIGSSATNLCSSDGTNKATSCGFGRFFNPRAYKWESEPFDIPSDFLVSNTYSTGFKFSVKFLSSAITPNSTWSIYLELVQVTGTGPVTYGTVYPLSDTTVPGALLNRSDEPICEQFYYSPGTDPDNGTISAGKYVLRIRFVTSNAVSSNNVCFDFDDIGLVIATNLSGDYEGDPSGLSQPTWSTGTASVTVDSTGRLVSSATLTKSAQSSVTCNDNGVPNGVLSHCATPSVKAIFHTIGYPKNQSGYDVIPFIAAIDEITIPYQSGAYTWTKTGVIHEDTNNTYKSFFTIPEWSTEDSFTFVNKTFEVTTPSKPARTLTINYVGGVFTANLSGAITANINLDSFVVYGYNTKLCTSSIEDDSLYPTITIPAGSTYAEGGDTPMTCTSLKKKLSVGGGVNGSYRANTNVFDINGHSITLMVAAQTCTPYPC